MTFLDTIKDEIIEHMPKKPCCRRMMLYGLLLARGSVTDDGKIELRLTHSGSVSVAVQLIKEQFNRQTEEILSHKGGRTHVLLFESMSAKKILTDFEAYGSAAFLQKRCPACNGAFLQGLFLAAGRIVDPQKTYHLELSLSGRAERIGELLQNEYGYSPKTAVRRSETLLYFKDSSAIEDFMTMLGLNDAAFMFMNCKIEKQFRNEANRRTNCEAGNITRSVNAAAKVLSVLRKMQKEGKLSALPEELLAIANLRLAFPEASLTQLAAATTPPITKSGVHHRLQKIMEFAQKYEQEK